MKSLCIGIGHFGVECIQAIEETLLPPKKYENLNQNKKFLYEAGTAIEEDFQKEKSTKRIQIQNAWGLLRLREADKRTPLGEVVDPKILKWKTKISEALIELLKMRGNSPKVHVYCFVKGDSGFYDPNYLDLKNLEAMLTSAIRETNRFENDFVQQDPNQRNIHIHYIFAAPEMTNQDGRSQVTQTFLNNLEILDKRIRVGKKLSGTFVSRIWIHSSLGLQQDDLSASCANFTRLLSREEVQKSSALSFLTSPYGSSHVSELISFFYMGSMSIPIGSVYHYAHLRLLYDGMNVLQKRVSSQKESNVENDAVIKKIKKTIEDLPKPGGKNHDEEPASIVVRPFDTGDSIRAQYGELYHPTEFENSNSKVDESILPKRYDKKEGQLILDMMRILQKEIMIDTDISDGLKNFCSMEEALQYALRSCQSDHNRERPSEDLLSPTEGIEELERCTRELPSQASMFANVLFVALPIALLLTSLGTSKYLGIPPSKKVAVSTLTHVGIWGGGVLLSFLLAYAIVYFQGIDKRKALQNALNYRVQARRDFLQSADEDDIQKQSKRAYQIRKERIRRIAVHVIVDMMGRLQAVKDAIFAVQNEYKQELQMLGVSIRQNEHDISIMLAKKKRYNISLIESKDLVKWISKHVMVKIDTEGWADNLIFKGWPKEGFLQDIPIGDPEDRYNDSYDEISVLHKSRPLVKIDNKEITKSLIRRWLSDMKNAPTPPCKPLKETNEPLFIRQTWEGGDAYMIYANNRSGIKTLLEDSFRGFISGFPEPIPINSNEDWVYALFLWEGIPFESIRRAYPRRGNG